MIYAIYAIKNKYIYSIQLNVEIYDAPATPPIRNIERRVKAVFKCIEIHNRERLKKYGQSSFQRTNI